MKKRKPLIIISIVVVIVIIVVILTSCFSKSPSESNVSAPVTDTALIEKQNLVNSISVSGNVEGDNLVKITSTVNSKIKTLNVSIGDSVKKGDILCTFDSSDFQDEYNSLKETVEKTQEMNQNTHEINQRNLLNAQKEKDAVLAQAQRAIDSAVDARDKAYQKYNDLIGKYNEYSEKKDSLYNQFQESGDELAYQEYQEALQLFTSTETELDTLESQLSTYDDAVQTAQDSYDSAERSADSSIQTIQDTIDSEKFNTDNSSQTQLEKLAQKIEDCTVKAPRDGIITSLSVAEGSIPATDAIMTIESNSNLKINVQIKEADILNVKEGMKATIRTDATGDKEFKGTVSKVVNIFSGADPATQTEGGYKAEITVDDSDTSLLIGMNAKVKIITGEKDNVLAVPYDAVSEDNIIYIARQQSDGSYKSEAVTIEKGMESDYYTEIISSEIKEGDLIVLSPQSMHNGRTIRIEENANE
ncbi:MAG TPA: hypothetical protein DCQ78_03410 [Ruminococcus sp.]|nr:hypothetical protein [Ruminococcus sp.]